jgi:hypothetical protein
VYFILLCFLRQNFLFLLIVWLLIEGEPWCNDKAVALWPVRSWVQVLEITSWRNVGEGCIPKTQSGWTLSRTCASGSYMHRAAIFIVWLLMFLHMQGKLILQISKVLCRNSMRVLHPIRRKVALSYFILCFECAYICCMHDDISINTLKDQRDDLGQGIHRMQLILKMLQLIMIGTFQQSNVFYKLYIMWCHIIYSVAFLL